MLLLVFFTVQCFITASRSQLEDFERESSCPIWMKNGSNNTCSCVEPDTVKRITKNCNSEARSIEIMACFCVSRYEELNKTLLGNCLYSCRQSYFYTIEEEDGPNFICDNFSREGELCGKCQSGMGYPLYSFSSTCIRCNSNWGVYIVMAFFPLTIFYVIIIVFRISLASGSLSSYLTIIQIMAAPTNLQYITTLRTTKIQSIFINIGISLMTIWNLDFFRSIYPGLCVNDKMSAVSIVSLDYAIAVYPLFLIMLTYILTIIHDRFHLTRYLWGPFHKLISRIRSHWNIKKSLVDAFGSFILLSYIKILNASFNILIPTNLYDLSGHFVSRKYLYYDGSQEVFKNRHIGYSTLALTMALLFNIAPLVILFLYPCRLFQDFLNRCNKPRLKLFLNTLMDSLQGHYKTEPFDCRYFATVSMITRVINLVLFSVTQTRFYYLSVCFLFLILAGVILTIKPYKSSRKNTINGILYLISAFIYAASSGYALSHGNNMYDTILLVLITAGLIIFNFYLVALITHFLKLPSLLRKIRDYFRLSNDDNISIPDNDDLFIERTTPLLELNEI